jgi:acid phosphatase family membrane protein YuiD
VALLWHGIAGALVFTLINAVLVTGLSVYAARQRVVRRGFVVKHGVMVGSWATVYALAIALGTTAFVDSPAFAAAAALGCALPLATGAWLEIRRTS